MGKKSRVNGSGAVGGMFSFHGAAVQGQGREVSSCDLGDKVMDPRALRTRFPCLVPNCQALSHWGFSRWQCTKTLPACLPNSLCLPLPTGFGFVAEFECQFAEGRPWR